MARAARAKSAIDWLTPAVAPDGLFGAMLVVAPDPPVDPAAAVPRVLLNQAGLPNRGDWA